MCIGLVGEGRKTYVEHTTRRCVLDLYIVHHTSALSHGYANPRHVSPFRRLVSPFPLLYVVPAIDTNSVNIILSIFSVCVCVSFLPIHSRHQARWTYQPGSHRRKEGHTGFFMHLPSAVRASIFLARRIQPFLSLVDREVYRILCTNDLIVLHSLGIFIFYFF